MSMQCEVGKENKHFVCTGSDESHVWNHLHNDVPKLFNCEHCAQHAKFEFRGLHDHVNLGLGKTAHNKKTYQKWVEEVNDVNKQCKLDGRC